MSENHAVLAGSDRAAPPDASRVGDVDPNAHVAKASLLIALWRCRFGGDFFDCHRPASTGLTQEAPLKKCHWSPATTAAVPMSFVTV